MSSRSWFNLKLNLHVRSRTSFLRSGACQTRQVFRFAVTCTLSHVCTFGKYPRARVCAFLPIPPGVFCSITIVVPVGSLYVWVVLGQLTWEMHSYKPAAFDQSYLPHTDPCAVSKSSLWSPIVPGNVRRVRVPIPHRSSDSRCDQHCLLTHVLRTHGVLSRLVIQDHGIHCHLLRLHMTPRP